MSSSDELSPGNADWPKTLSAHYLAKLLNAGEILGFQDVHTGLYKRLISIYNISSAYSFYIYLEKAFCSISIVSCSVGYKLWAIISTWIYLTAASNTTLAFYPKLSLLFRQPTLTTVLTTTDVCKCNLYRRQKLCLTGFLVVSTSLVRYCTQGTELIKAGPAQWNKRASDAITYLYRISVGLYKFWN